MLKDYLRDDLSSCSSNGFKSFPRRQCCTTVRFLLEIDLNTNPNPNPKHTRQQFFKRSRSSKAASTTISALQKASEAVIKAVKLLPFLPPSSSLHLRSYTTEVEKEDFFCPEAFRGSYSRKASGGRLITEKEKAARSDGGELSEWPNEENKEQFSPVSVLDCPFQDEEDISPPFQRSLVRMEGAKLRFRANIIRFEKLAQLDPLNLEKQMELAGLEDETLKSPIKARSSSFHNNMFSDIKEDKSAYELLKLVKATIPSNHRLISEADSILLDFFREKIMENKASGSMVEGQNKDLEKELEVAQDWINGHPQEMFLGWEVKDSRVVYLREMERKGT
ncbi:hypothetical protein GH714_001970 [Hevea brasiliensis]|uniref:Uncharacterized protein n=1 Tax=Hevea brasiliensis TaxID=3981 RepID=A0A6A6LCB5_HEVBR|nr:hypothetical protein GH714_001970 [Hevea brasiliensis]